jgi:hypothetical protein
MKNPYEPPRAEIDADDSGQPESSPAPPKSVARAVTCLVTCTVFAGLVTLGEWMGFWRSVAASRTLQNVLSVMLLAIITWKISTRRRWALWFAIVMYLGGLAATLASLAIAPQTSLRILAAAPVQLLVSGIVQYVLQGVAIALLLGPESRKWFRGSGAA